MDPDKLMADIIADYEVWRNPSTPSYAANLTAMTILEHVSDLHDWIGKGGFEPHDYARVAEIVDEVYEWYKGSCDDGGSSWQCSDTCTAAWSEHKVYAWYDNHGIERNWSFDCE